MKPRDAVYLGDSVYASFDGDMIKLFTNNGLGADQVIFLELEVYAALVVYAHKCFENNEEIAE